MNRLSVLLGFGAAILLGAVALGVLLLVRPQNTRPAVPLEAPRAILVPGGRLTAEQITIVADLRNRVARKDKVEILAWGPHESPIGGELYSAPAAQPELMKWNVVGKSVFEDAPPTYAQRVRYRVEVQTGELKEDERVWLLRDNEVIIVVPVGSYRPPAVPKLDDSI